MFYTIINKRLMESYRIYMDSLEDAITATCRLKGWRQEDCVGITDNEEVHHGRLQGQPEHS